MSEQETRELAERIAADLFTHRSHLYENRPAKAVKAMADRIEKHLRGEL